MRGSDFRRNDLRNERDRKIPTTRLIYYCILRIVNDGCRFPAWLLLLLFWTGNRPLAALTHAAAMFIVIWASGKLLVQLGPI
jgi:hypothetical protein